MKYAYSDVMLRPVAQYAINFADTVVIDCYIDASENLFTHFRSYAEIPVSKGANLLSAQSRAIQSYYYATGGLTQN